MIFTNLLHECIIKSLKLIVETGQSNILINVHKDGSKKMRWKNGSDYPKSVVITDFQIFDTDEIFGSAGWAPPEQWLGQLIR